MSPLIPCFWAAGVVQVVIAAANWRVPDVLGYQENLAKVSRVVRQVFILHSIFIVLTVLLFGGLCLGFARELAAGGRLERFLCASMAVFWTARLFFQIFYFDARFKQEHRGANLGYTLAISFLSGVFLLGTLGIAR